MINVVTRFWLSALQKIYALCNLDFSRVGIDTPMNSWALSLVASTAFAGAAFAGSWPISWPVRMVVTLEQNPRPFSGVTLQNFGLITSPHGCHECSDEFRHDDIVIWSVASGSKWRVLPPRRLGDIIKRMMPE